MRQAYVTGRINQVAFVLFMKGSNALGFVVLYCFFFLMKEKNEQRPDNETYITVAPLILQDELTPSA